MVYRVTGVFRRRIDEILPYFRHAEVVEEPNDTLLRIRSADPLAGSVEVRSSPPGFYVHWWTAHPGLVETQEQRDIVFSNIGRWTEELYQKERYVDFGRKSGDLTVGHYGLLPYAADPALSARLIDEGMAEIVGYRTRVEAILRQRLAPKA
jgi:hypothetical protein